MYTSPDRFYRRLPEDAEEQSLQIVVEESDLWIRAPRALPTEDLRTIALQELMAARSLLKLWIAAHPTFKESLVPIDEPVHTQPLVSAMYRAGQFAAVGPFAAVAGAIAEAVARAIHAKLMACGLPGNVLVENGGDMFMFSAKERLVSLLVQPDAYKVGRNASFPQLALRLAPSAFPCALAASSATIGHSLSFGKADLVVAHSANGALADACATALANVLTCADDLQPFFAHLEKRGVLPAFMPKAFPTARLDGVFAFVDSSMGFWDNTGKVEIVQI